MGWRIRYMGGPSSRKKSIRITHPLGDADMDFRKGVIYDMPPSEARWLLDTHPDDFERVSPLDPDTHNRQRFAFTPRPASTVRRVEVGEPVSDTVRLRALRSVVWPGPNGSRMTIPAGSEFDAPAEEANEYVGRTPEDFEIVPHDS